VLFSLGSLLGYTKYEKDKWENKAKNKDKRRARLIPIIRPRIYLYKDNYYINIVAISEV